MSRTAVLFTVIALVGASACSDSGDSSPPDSVVTDGATTTPTTTPPTTAPDSLPPVTFLSEPVDAGPLLGRGAEDVEADSVAPPDAEPCLDDEEICEDYPDAYDPPPERPPFVPAPADAAFCAVLADLEDRPFPSDEYEAIVVTKAWFAELSPTVPPEYAADFAVLTDWLDRALAAEGEITFDEEYGEEVDAAADRLGDYVDSNCYGFGVDEPDVPPTEPDVPPTEPEVPPTDPDIPTTDGEFELAGPLFGEDARDDFLATGSLDVNEFAPAPDLAPFCTLINEIALRPFPTDEIAQVSIAQTWLEELQPLVPQVVAANYAVLKDWVDRIAESETFDDAADPETDAAVATAAGALDDYVDTNCYGY